MSEKFDTQINGLDIVLVCEDAFELQRRLDIWTEKYIKKNNFAYTVQRCTDDGSRHGYIHYSGDGHATVCGIELNKYWWILTNDHKGIANCPECIKLQKERNL